MQVFYLLSKIFLSISDSDWRTEAKYGHHFSDTFWRSTRTTMWKKFRLKCGMIISNLIAYYIQFLWIPTFIVGIQLLLTFQTNLIDEFSLVQFCAVVQLIDYFWLQIQFCYLQQMMLATHVPLTYFCPSQRLEKKFGFIT